MGQVPWGRTALRLTGRRSMLSKEETGVSPKIVELAPVGVALEPEEAVARVAALIDGLDVHSATYEADVAALAQIGATIWAMAGRSSSQG
jgi:hypothetical protein